MSVPKYDEMYIPFLAALKNGKVRSLKDVKADVANQMNLSDEDLMILLPSGKQAIFENRIGWTRTYLKKAGLIESPERAMFVITEEGIKALSQNVNIDNDYLMQYESFQDFQRRKKKDTYSVSLNNYDKSPEEILEDAHAELNGTLADDLLVEIMKISPTSFEHLVVKLLLAMGYGSGIDEAGFVTKASSDGGIDGIIKEDQLGFSSIYIQAKQWDPKRVVDRPEIQKFVGALHEQNAQKGLFITTASFTKGAKNSAESAGIVLVDGNQLTKLMIKVNLGVSVEHVYEVKRLDTDFFEAF